MATYTGEQLAELLKQNPASLTVEEAAAVIAELRGNTPETRAVEMQKIIGRAKEIGVEPNALAQDYFIKAGNAADTAAIDQAIETVTDNPFRFKTLVEEALPDAGPTSTGFVKKAVDAPPLTQVEFDRKVADGTVTIGEVLDNLIESKNVAVSDNKRKTFTTLKNTLSKTGVDPSTPWVELRNPEVYLQFTEEGSADGVNRVKGIQSLEQSFLDTNKRITAAVSFPNPATGVPEAAYVQVFGLKGETKLDQARATNAMRGVVPLEAVRDIYDGFLPELRETNPDLANMMELHKNTGFRIEHILPGKGSGAIKVADVKVGNDYVEIDTYGNKTKNRPKVRFSKDSATGRAILDSYERNKGSNFLFGDTNITSFNDAFRTYVSPTLASDFAEQVPLTLRGTQEEGAVKKVPAPKVTPSVIRDINARALGEMGFSNEEVQLLMGHTDSSVLAKSYQGNLERVAGRIGSIAEDTLEKGLPYTVGTTPEDRKLQQAEVDEATEQRRLAKAEASIETRKRIAEFEASPEGLKLSQQEMEIKKRQIEQQAELEQFKAEKKAELKAAKEPEKPEVERVKLTEQQKEGLRKMRDAAIKRNPALARIFEKAGSGTLKALPFVGPVVIGAGVYSESVEAGDSSLVAGAKATAAGAGALAWDVVSGAAGMVAESTPIGEGSDVVPETDSEYYPSAMAQPAPQRARMQERLEQTNTEGFVPRPVPQDEDTQNFAESEIPTIRR